MVALRKQDQRAQCQKNQKNTWQKTPQNQNSETKTWTLMMFWPESPWCERLRMDSFRTVDSGPIRGFIWRTTPGNKNRQKYQETSIGFTSIGRLPKKGAWIWLLNVQDFPFFFSTYTYIKAECFGDKWSFLICKNSSDTLMQSKNKRI